MKGVSVPKMAGNITSASFHAAAAADSADARFPAHERRSRWVRCFSGLSCFGSQKGGKRIVPATRVADGTASTSNGHGPRSTNPSNQTTNQNHSLLAPPSSPASFTNSALPSTVQSPSSFMSMSANSPGGPTTSTMFITGPYAHETQLVSPPVFSTFTTEPSTAPLTPPPELAHLTTPSSPEVPYAQYLSSAAKQNGMPYFPSCYSGGTDLQSTYSLYPGSPSSSLISPASGTPRTGLSSPYPEQEVASTQPGSNSSTSRNFMLPANSSFFCPAASAQFYLDQAQQSFPYGHNGGRLSVSRETDVHSNGANRRSKNCVKQDEEIEAYRASFGFSSDEIITSQKYIEPSEPSDDSFTMSPFGVSKPCVEAFGGAHLSFLNPESIKASLDVTDNHDRMQSASKQTGQSDLLNCGLHPLKIGNDRLSSSMHRQLSKRYLSSHSCSDAEIEFRRARSLKDTHSLLARRNSPS